ncbi:MAG TPA: antibiotic biosynthesis monooxygenase [Vicinamibacterales bacterium]
MNSVPVRMTVRWAVPQGESRPITSALQGLMVTTRSEPGCAGCSLSTHMGAQALIDYVEEWQSEDDLKRELRSDRFTQLAELMERASEPPIVQFNLAGTTRGLEYAREVRERRSA